jgi:hypothetical protein
MNFPQKIIKVLEKSNKPLKSSQILALLKKADPTISIDKKTLNQIIWKDLRQKINYNSTDFTISIKGKFDENGITKKIPNEDRGAKSIHTIATNPYEFPVDLKKEINLVDVLKIVAEEKLRLGTHEANLMAENITIRLKKKYGSK